MAASTDTAAILAAIGDVRRSTKAFVQDVTSRKFSEASLRAAHACALAALAASTGLLWDAALARVRRARR